MAEYLGIFLRHLLRYLFSAGILLLLALINRGEVQEEFQWVALGLMVYALLDAIRDSWRLRRRRRLGFVTTIVNLSPTGMWNATNFSANLTFSASGATRQDALDNLDDILAHYEKYPEL